MIDASDLHVESQYESIVMINVLEHLADDRAALQSLGGALTPGGRLVVYVPAFMLLYSKFDREIGHYRRYRRPALSHLFEDTGFRVVESRYVNSIGALGWFVYCRVLDDSPRTISRSAPATEWSYRCSAGSSAATRHPSVSRYWSSANASVTEPAGKWGAIGRAPQRGAMTTMRHQL